jgi:putative ABC transport system permease protein
VSTLARKSLSDLTRRKARSAFAILTLAIAVASIGIFALPALADRMMQKEIRSTQLADLVVYTRPLELGRGQLAALGRLPNVSAVEGRSFYATRAYLGERRVATYVVGVPDFADQHVDIVHLASGTAPRRDQPQALTEVMNARQGTYDGTAGDQLTVLDSDGLPRVIEITGEGRNMTMGLTAGESDAIVIYTTPGTVDVLSRTPGFTSLSFRLDDTSRAAANATAASVERYLRAHTAFTGFTDLPSVRAPGDWPGKEFFEKFSQLLYVLTALALVAGLVLVVNTMGTIVGEQTREIGQMKAIGGTDRQIRAIYLRTAFLMGLIASVIGAAIGAAIANLVTNFFGSSFYGMPAQIAFYWPVLAASVLVGLVGPMLASLPAIRRGVRIPVRAALEATGAEVGGSGRLDRLLRRVAVLPPTFHIGVRSVARRRRRSLATVVQIAFAVGTLLAVLGLGTSIANLTHSAWSDHNWEIWVGSSMRQPFDAKAAQLVREAPGVAGAQPVITNDARANGKVGFVWGTPATTLFGYRLTDGRWYTPAEEHARARVAVLESAIAHQAGVGVGDRVRLDTATGPESFRVVGVVKNVQENGTVVFVPLATLKQVLGTGGAVNGFWVTTGSKDHAVSDMAAAKLEELLSTNGYEIGIGETWVGEADNVASNRQMSTTITVLGFLIVSIGMVGLVSAITMSVLERTREIGILRCVGARARHVRRVFATEGLVLALAGWLLGIPFGYAIDRLFGWLVGRIFSFDMPVAFPPLHVLLALGGTIVLAWLLMRLPLRRAVRFRPGEALRYG